jgi:hypothetical protein
MQEYYFGLVPGEEAIDRLVDGIIRDPADAARDPSAHLNGLWRRISLRWAAAHPDSPAGTGRDPSRCI